MGQKAFPHYKLGSRGKLSGVGPVGGIHTLNLDHLHLHVAVFLHVDFRARIQDALAVAVTLAVMLLHIFDLCILSHKEAVDSVML